MRFVRPKNECVTGNDFHCAILVTHGAVAAHDEIKLPLCRVRVVRKSWFPGRNSIPFQIEWMTLRQIERSWFAPERFRNSFEGRCVFPARRLPRLFFDLVE